MTRSPVPPRSDLRPVALEAVSPEAVEYLLTFPPHGRSRCGYVHEGTWTKAGQVHGGVLTVHWLGADWSLPAGKDQRQVDGPIEVTLTLCDGLLRARSAQSNWGPLRVRDCGVFFWDATAEELQASSGICLGAVVEGTGRLSVIHDAFQAAPGVEHAGQNVLVCFKPGHLSLFDREGRELPTDGVLRRTDPRPKATVKPDRWESFAADLSPERMAETGRQYLLKRLTDQPESIDADGRSLLLAGILMGEVPNTQGHIILYHWDAAGVHKQGYSGGKALASKRVIVWLAGPYLRIYTPDGELVATRAVPHPVAHEFSMFRPWRGRDVHVVSLRHRSDVARTSVTVATRLHTLKAPGRNLQYLLTEEQPDNPPSFWLTDESGTLVAVKSAMANTLASGTVRRRKLLAEAVGPAPDDLLLRVVERFGERLVSWYLETAPPPQSTELKPLYVALLGWWARQPGWNVYDEGGVMAALAWWRRVTELPDVLNGVYRTATGLDFEWPALSPGDREGWAHELSSLGVQARATESGLWVTARRRA